jgi:hypothetical protein
LCALDFFGRFASYPWTVAMTDQPPATAAAIAEAMGRGETAVDGLLRRGLKRLRELMHASD